MNVCALGDVCTRYHFGSRLDYASKHYIDDDKTKRQRQSEELRETILLHILPVVGCRQLVSKTTPKYPHEAIWMRVLWIQSGESRTVSHSCVQSSQQKNVLPVLIYCSRSRGLIRPSNWKQSVSYLSQFAYYCMVRLWILYIFRNSSKIYKAKCFYFPSLCPT